MAQIRATIKGLAGKRILVVASKSRTHARQATTVLASNIVQLRYDAAARVHAPGNWVEEFSNEAKDGLGPGPYLARGLKGHHSAPEDAIRRAQSAGDSQPQPSS